MHCFCYQLLTNVDNDTNKNFPLWCIKIGEIIDFKYCPMIVLFSILFLIKLVLDYTIKLAHCGSETA